VNDTGNNGAAAEKVPAMELAIASHHCGDALHNSAWRKFHQIAAIAFVLESNAFSLQRTVNGTKRGQPGYETERQLNKIMGVVT
jgi:hypothetical protein